MTSNHQLTVARLKELVNYDPESGEFRRLRTNGRHCVGSLMGRWSADGYREISVDGKSYLASRLAWLYMTGEWPKFELDHKDHNRGNDRFANLRQASRSENMANRRYPHRYRGIARVQRGWMARIRVNGALIYLGHFATPEAAALAYNKAADAAFGEFASLNLVSDVAG